MQLDGHGWECSSKDYQGGVSQDIISSHQIQHVSVYVPPRSAECPWESQKEGDFFRGVICQVPVPAGPAPTTSLTPELPRSAADTFLSRCCSEQGELCRSQTSPKTQHLSVYQELSGEMSLISAAGNLSSRDEALSAEQPWQGRMSRAPPRVLSHLCPTLLPSKGTGTFHFNVPGQRALVSLADMAFVARAGKCLPVPVAAPTESPLFQQ